jgi:hypothetical protein
MKIFSLVIVILFFVLGFYMVFSSYFKNLPLNIRIIIAFFIFAYGSFRLVSIIYKPKPGADEDE